MAYELPEGKGSAFINKKKDKETAPDYNGSIKVNGEEIKFGMWRGTTKNGETYFKFSVSRATVKAQEYAKQWPKEVNKHTDFDDSVPF